MPGCGSAWKKPSIEHLLVERLEQLAPGLAALRAVDRLAYRRAVDELEHEQPRRREVAVEARHGEPRVRREHLAHALDVLGLLQEVELAPQRLGEVLHERRDVDGAAQRLALERLLGEELEQAEVARDLLARARPLHLDDDVIAVLERRAVHLPDRPGRERRRLDRLEDVLPRHLQLLLHHVDDLRLGQRRDVVLELRQLVDDVGRDEVRPRREDLAELRERRAELLERGAQPPRAIRGRRCGARVEPEAREDARDVRRAAEQARVLDVLRLGLRDGAVGRVDDDDGAARRVRDAVRDVAEQELLPPAHARVADDEHVGLLLVDRAHDRAGDVGIDLDDRARAVQLGGISGERFLGALDGRRQHLEQHEFAVGAVREIGRPRDGLARGLGAVRCDDDLHLPLYSTTRTRDSHHDRPLASD